MSTDIYKNFVDQFNANVMMISQQKTAKFVGKCRHETFTGKKASFDRIGPTAVFERVGRHADTRFANTSHDRRWITAKTYDWAELIDDVDKLRMLYDPQNIYAQNAGAAFARQKDDNVLAAALADCMTGEDGTTNLSWAAQTDRILDSSASPTTGLTISKLLAIRELKELSDVDPDLPWTLAVSPKQITTLLNTTEIKDADYNTVKALAAGQINSFMGFDFVWSNRLAKTTNGLGTKCIAFAQGGLVLATQQELKTTISQRPDKNNATQIHITMTLGAVRMEEEKVIQINCVD